MNLPLKVRLLNVFRNVFRIPVLEKSLVRLTTGRSPNALFAKLAPNPYQYPPHSFRYVEHDGIKMRLDISDYIGHYLYFGFSDESHRKLFDLCGKGHNILDIGANVGWTMLKMSKLSSPGVVYGFEPDPYNYERCLENLSLNKFNNVTVFPVGLSDVNAKLNMEVRVASNRGGNRITSGVGQQVDVMKLDDFEAVKNLHHIDVIKIDVEGYELNVLKGAKAVLQQHHPVLFIELDDSNLRDQGYSATDLISFLNSCGYNKIVSAEDDHVVSVSDNFSDCHFDIVARQA